MMRESIKNRLSDACRKAAEVQIGFVWTCGAVPFREKGKVVSMGDSFVVIRDSDGHEDPINFCNIFEVEEL